MGLVSHCQRHGVAYGGNRSSLQFALSKLTRRTRCFLPCLVRLLRGETASDPRPNKALQPTTCMQLLSTFKYRDLMIKIVQEGFHVVWRHDLPKQQNRPPNHISAVDCSAQVLQRIRECESGGAYLVVDADVFSFWSVSLGAVTKEHDSIRLIHDLSCPRGDCPNHMTVTCSLHCTNSCTSMSLH
ncbi:hypothetical protein PHYSODRAFT_530399 [Phytophthora sojae]|uniref:Uncharacterized protein n=1 Tax=Phytophthora sojae (strain P6497) TaxID=1094619 RepID=G5ABP1_PHYSP|nr:hypothetical protein PHYSODRAFT_530399 [Phytophthora sojae]EGZ06766.1 hypothetical protein PHYSODRAFT_530399 [Phytophthora sojae]|eukprot:XP_009537530.1 hypothetical protein PHYSODRAFT_530399 [Phytophthora sojae]